METRIYNNLKDTRFILDTKRFKFYFSSEFNKRRYTERVFDFINIEIGKIIAKYKINELEFNKNINEYLQICFYKKIEKRGFLVYDKLNNDYFRESF